MLVNQLVLSAGVLSADTPIELSEKLLLERVLTGLLTRKRW